MTDDRFIFQKYNYSISEYTLTIEYNFQLVVNEVFNFNPKLVFHLPKVFFNQNYNHQLLDKLIFNLGLVEAISYWKSKCCKNFIVKCGHLTDEQKNWWKNLFFYGLGEFRYINKIKTTIDDFVDIKSEATKEVISEEKDEQKPDSNRIIIPIGGGKDSVVTIEELKSGHQVIPFIININDVTEACINIAGYTKDDAIIINRKIAKQLLELNAAGCLNGHTPFSAVIAFSTLIGAELTNTSLIALSNEASANEATVKVDNCDIINHQYSKTIIFEAAFRKYYSRFISSKYNYFSYLRNISELRISQKFSNLKQYHKTFKSCNVGSKTKPWRWCCNCPKCLFVYIILSPFLETEELISIFGTDLFDNFKLQDTLYQLTGLSKTKPFECIGTIDETRAAIAKYLSKHEATGILKEYVKKTDISEDLSNFDKITLQDNSNNFIPKDLSRLHHYISENQF
ncbi:MAG: hypothetical protein PHU62_07840 [Bacteroidales bacterium]|jgi:UDP-N-acetyl-alpha-D-muramoyl-L-alanyl-L-glutamate epimerase|nr:hypothetical protein [Bacteroidales bacterium]MDD2205110.1 hypothetical protein [Bacteroidales bacterium]MDD3152555.1 hypothetical protein [Bacteroidales bacterium]MDD3914592.1 hypothetical protein [Bacteroidales bacterium]MDD4634463.1 hypothetical protein [Bacteroidales bacterium]